MLDPNDKDQYALIVMILLAWQAAEISEGQAVLMTGHDRMTLRVMRDACLDAVKQRWAEKHAQRHARPE